MDLEELVFNFNKIIIHPKFIETVNEVSKLGVSNSGINQGFSFDYEEYTLINGELVNTVGDIEKVKLNPDDGLIIKSDRESIAAYDESIILFLSLEGSAYFTSHSLVFLSKHLYLPSNYLTFYFYTKSKTITERSHHIYLSEDVGLDSKKQYIKDRINFLENAVPNNSILLVDGPLIGGDVYTYLIQSIDKLHEKNIIPIFFVKNSSSNLVTNNIFELQGKYNSDLHWSYNFLDPGSRSNFFIYKDRVNPRNAKAFCYIKPYDLSPQRVEFHLDTFNIYYKRIPELLDLIYYLILVQGNMKNPQVRPIAVAEMYARETLKMLSADALMKKIGIIPTMNQTRFGS